MKELVGKLINHRYQVESWVDAGGMAVVYRVWDREMNVPLAMKVLRADLHDDPRALERFEREGRALQKLAHPHIVPFYGIERSGEMIFLLEKYIDGATLKAILGSLPERRMGLLEALIYLKAVCSALGYAHANGVVHCDVKPGNVMVDRTGGIFLADFGIARHAESTTTTLAGAGSPAYMAPEQIKGLAVSPETDVYALGVMLFEMLTGRRPFTGSEGETGSGSNATAAERMRSAHLSLAPPDPRSLVPDLPPMLSEVILCALEKEPNRRYPDAMGLFQAVCAAAGVAPDQVPDHVAPPPITSTPISNEAGTPARYRTPLALAGGALVLAVILCAAVYWMMPAARGLIAAPATVTKSLENLPAVIDTPLLRSTEVTAATPVPVLTATKEPTYTPYPTFTPPPTYTPFPSPTFTPSSTPTPSQISFILHNTHWQHAKVSIDGQDIGTVQGGTKKTVVIKHYGYITIKYCLKSEHPNERDRCGLQKSAQVDSPDTIVTLP